MVRVLFQDPNTRFRNEAPVSLDGALAAIATDYTKRQHVFRLKLSNGGDYLLNAKDDVCICTHTTYACTLRVTLWLVTQASLLAKCHCTLYKVFLRCVVLKIPIALA